MISSKVEGCEVESGYESLIGPTVPESMIPDDLKKISKEISMSLHL